MQTKTIRKNITEKLNDWLSSITDKALRGKVKDDLLVSGGCIVSLFLNEQVNDYDIYLKTKSIVIDLAEYYTRQPQVGGIEVLDGRRKQEYLDRIPEYLQTEDTQGIFKISIDNLKSDQVKLWFQDKTGNHKVEYSKEDNTELPKYRPVFFSPNAISLSDNIQIILRFHGDNEAIHKTFDFVHATNYFTFEKGLVTNVRALESILSKQLFYQGSLYPLTSIIRMKKFLKRGWNISAGEMLKIMFQISELDLKNPNVLEEQLIGVDVAYFEKLIDILRNIQHKDYTSEYLNTIIDRVFNNAEEEQ